MADRNFDATRERKGHTFTLGGKKFRTYPGMSIPYIKRRNARKESDQLDPLDDAIEFVRELIVKEDRPKFDEMVEAEDVYFDAKDLIDLQNWLLEVISGRPTKRPVSSGGGSKANGTGSKAKSSSRAVKTSKT